MNIPGNLGIAFLACLVCLALGCGGTQTPTQDKPLEVKLATLDKGSLVPDDDITLSRFKFLLDQLTVKFTEDRQAIADMSVKARSMLREIGIQESLLNIMEGMNRAMFTKVGNQKYAEYVAAYVTLRRQGQSHDEGVEGLRALIQSLGVR